MTASAHSVARESAALRLNRPSFVDGGFHDELQISPELALVCPELRARALAQLPDRDPDGWIPRRFSEPWPAVAAPLSLVVEPSMGDASSAAAVAPPRMPEVATSEFARALTGITLLAAASVYFLRSVAESVIFGVKFVAVATAVVLSAEILHYLI